ncbi:cytochrome P450 [Sphingopyxis terrae]|uniref:cytochrome P450 n=1 Tax=Sphingopyxis terrae TaxID=33052 RepID=UPI002A17DF3A|nr:cytochrome P450 [Sphingopyxis terrae]MDX8356397.1 cytochrome P450 [Sphingopyxis terrae]
MALDVPDRIEGYPDASRYIDAGADPEIVQDPYPTLARVMEHGPVQKAENGRVAGVRLPDNFMFEQNCPEVYFALTYSACRKVGMDAKNFSNASAYGPTLGRTFGETLMALDAPRHTQLKRLVLPAFSHRIVNEDLVKIATPVVNEALDRIVDKGRGELIADFCAGFPFVVVARILGVPDDLAQEAEDLVIAATTMHDDPARALAALDEMNTLYMKVVQAHRQGGYDDLTSALLEAEIDGAKLTDDEVVGFIKQIIAAGLDTTVRATATFIYLMLEHPDQFEDLQRNPDLLENAVYEAMRHQAAGGYLPRVALNDVELEGVRIPAGSGVYGVIHSANRDPARWDDPERFDIRRPRQQFMTLGTGPHACLGANLTIAEQMIALKAVFARLKNLRKDPDRWDDAKLRGFQLRSPTQLPVLWDA